MKPAMNHRIGNGIGSDAHRHARKRIARPILVSMLSVAVILGCVTIMPGFSQQEQTPATDQPFPVSRATRTAVVPVTETQESECSRLDLTSQECASLGQHLITVSGVVDGYCWYGDDDRTVTRDLPVTVSFSNDGSGKKVTIKNAIFIDCPAGSTGENTYAYDCITHSNRNTGTIVFVDNGFLNEGGFTNSVNKNCTWSEVYTLP